MTIGGRLKSVVKDNGLKLTEFARKTNIPYRTLQKYVADEIIPGGESLAKINTELDVSIDWLLTGKGTPFSQESQSPEEIDKVMKKLKPEQRQEILSRSLEMEKMNEAEMEMKRMAMETKNLRKCVEDLEDRLEGKI